MSGLPLRHQHQKIWLQRTFGAYCWWPIRTNIFNHAYGANLVCGLWVIGVSIFFFYHFVMLCVSWLNRGWENLIKIYVSCQYVTILKLTKLTFLTKVKLVRICWFLERKINMVLYPLKIIGRSRFALSQTSLTSIFVKHAPTYKISDYFNKIHPYNISW